MTPSPSLPLVDSFGRLHSDLRVSVTDRCNLRCVYCMPEEVKFLPRKELLSYDELARFVEVVSELGVRTVRLTGGEPLVRRELHRLVRMISDLPRIEGVALTTNGLLLEEQAEELFEAGLQRLNVSLDALSPAGFERIARRTGLEKVLAGLRKAREVGFERIKLNAVALRGETEAEVVPLAEFARRHGFELRFIEYMPLDADRRWDDSQVLGGAEVVQILEERFGPLDAVAPPHPSQPARDFVYRDGGGRIGFVNPVSEPFCSACNRLRITAEGKLRNCLFSTEEWDVRALLREGASNAEVAALVRDCLLHKKPGHGISTDAFVRPERAMYQIGG